ncbi:hypothetical protein HZC33_01820 [Candidatus Wolfebacteria bacterium]|nr:hypothetical protein [Candidatus Wolfebacteria bacterium]
MSTAIAEALDKAKKKKENEEQRVAVDGLGLSGAQNLLNAISGAKQIKLTPEELSAKAETDKVLREAAQQMAVQMDAMEDSLNKIMAEAEKFGLDLGEPGSQLGKKAEEIQMGIDDLLKKAQRALSKEDFEAFKSRVEFSRFLNSVKKTPLESGAIIAQLGIIAKIGRGKPVRVEDARDNSGKFPEGALVFKEIALLPISSGMPGANGQSKADYVLFNAMRNIIKAFFEAERKEEGRLMTKMSDPQIANGNLSFFLKRVPGKYLVMFEGKHDAGTAIVELGFRNGKKENEPQIVVYIVDGAGAFKALRQMEGVYIPFYSLWIKSREEREQRIDAAIPKSFGEEELAVVQKLAYTIRIQTASLREQFRKEKEEA